MNFKAIENSVIKLYPEGIVSAIMEIKDSFIVCLVPKNLKNGDISLDSFFKVNKRTHEVTEYSPVMDPEEFKSALKNIVYKRGASK
jgi:hypothetical protein